MSTRWLCDQAPNARVITVDHWLGSSDHRQSPEYRPLLPTLYETILAASWDYREQIIPVRADTAEAMTWDRPYRKALPISALERVLLGNSPPAYNREAAGICLKLLRNESFTHNLYAADGSLPPAA